MHLNGAMRVDTTLRTLSAPRKAKLTPAIFEAVGTKARTHLYSNALSNQGDYKLFIFAQLLSRRLIVSTLTVFYTLGRTPSGLFLGAVASSLKVPNNTI